MENIKSGMAIPNPKKMNVSKFMNALVVEVLRANHIIRDAGLHGRTIAPKNSPKISADKKGFLVKGELIFGKNFPKSKSKIKNKLISPSIAKAIGEIIPIAFVKEV